ncbi:ATPase family protein [Corynebacterium sp. CMW7794]|uniref:AAA family ATPase n=1 Tax=unclassified Corynebacterium TaxID=2624378 RepID=UPI00079C6137|nr:MULTISPECIES: AAA family ATPase [unclassified Corynebacterium]KXI19868.1 ATPase family protein [Corynebacterium sp. CMW7794]OFN42386.1 hypothetical protein HMPREF2559_11635 [Corynebacterium sp. HMSC072G08]
MLSTSTLLTLSDYAQAEAKKRSEPATAWHLAAALQDKYPKLFADIFGEGGADLLRTSAHASLSALDVSVRRLQESAPPQKAETFRSLLRPTSTAEAATAAPNATPVAATDSSSDSAPNAMATLDTPAPTAQSGERATAESTGAAGEARTVEQAHAASEDSAGPRSRFLDAAEARAVPESQTAAIRQAYVQATGAPEVPCVVVVPEGRRTSEVADYLAAMAEDGVSVSRFNPDFLFSKALNFRSLRKAFAGIDATHIVVLDCVETILGLTSPYTATDVAAAVDTFHVTATPHPVLVLPQAAVGTFEEQHAALADAAVRVTLPPLTNAEATELVQQVLIEEAAAAQLTVDEDVRPLITAPAAPTDTLRQPAVGINRARTAIRSAQLRGARAVTTADVDTLTSSDNLRVRSAELIAALKKQVHGQDYACEVTARRLALTHLNWDLNPQRPNGVFLFAGPSGVGKTQLAKALCEALYDDAQRLIRLDMSEYHQEWAISRLTGPQPGYVGSTEPDSWLTTRVRKQPHTVLLLDEIEKAHPKVWNTFLQVFDAGRLTDSRGEVADFSDTVIIMTSNLGATSMNVSSLGFGGGTQTDLVEASRERVLGAVKKSMAPELVNRMDAIIPFQPLGKDTIRAIALQEIERITARLAGHGYALTVTDAAVDLIADSGYEPAFGARHVQRAVENLLLLPMPELEPGFILADAVDGKVVLAHTA